MSHAIRMSEEEWKSTSARLTTLRRVKQAPAKQSKYRNTKTQIEGITFQSGREAKRYVQLRQLETAGLIQKLRIQVPFILAPSVVIKGRKRPPLRYMADFVYDDADGNQVVEDSKGKVTEGYRIKRHLMKSLHGIDIQEV